MKQGRALVDLAMEVQRQANVKADFVADTRKLEFVPNGRPPPRHRGPRVLRHR